jgi:hypothetical protein
MLRAALASIRRPGLAIALAAVALASAVAGTLAGTAAASPHAPVPLRAPRAGGGGASDPTCTPQTLDASALLDGAVTVSPMPGAADASPQTQISFLGVPASALSELTVTGLQSGTHTGTLEPYSQGDGGSFLPLEPFVAGETVTVSAQLTLNGAAQPLQFQFTIAQQDPLSDTQQRQNPIPTNSVQSFVSRPDLLPPVVAVRAQSPQVAAGDELLAPYGVPAQAGPMILDPAGRLVWFDPLPRPMAATNLRVQQYGGEPVLTWWQGTITVHGFGLGEDVIAGSHYQTIAQVHAGNGYQADLHEFQITPAGTALLTAYNAVHCDLYALGGNRDSAVTDSLLQEIDVKTGLVMYEWDSLDHIPLTDSYVSLVHATATAPFDFFHLNSINLDPDGTLLVSSRNTWSVDDIDPQTGQLLWTLGGKQSSFSEGRGAATAFQHDARPDGPGTYSVFDNGASPQVHAQSRGVVLAVNTQTHTVSVQTQYLHAAHPLLAKSQGDMQALPNGDWFVGWGQERDLSEFSPGGTLLFDASLPPGYESYRSLRFQWSAAPLSPPALTVRADTSGRATAYVSWNGATAVASWELLEGSSPGRLARVRVVAREGFETAIALAPEPRLRFAAARALDSGGAVLGSSAAVALAPRAHTGG